MRFKGSEQVIRDADDRFGVEHCVSRQTDPLPGDAAEKLASTARGLVCPKLGLAEAFRPVGRDVAVAGTADRVLVHAELGSEGARDAVVRRAARCDVDEQAVQP